jgi:hypothetical protein
MDAIDDREKVLTDRLVAIEVEIDALIPKLGDPKNLTVVSSTVSGSSLAGQTRLQQLMELKEKTQSELWALPAAYDVPMVLGSTLIGEPNNGNE